MSRHHSFNPKGGTRRDKRHPGQAWAADKKRGLVPSSRRPQCPKSHGRSGQGMVDELASQEAYAASRSERSTLPYN